MVKLSVGIPSEIVVDDACFLQQCAFNQSHHPEVLKGTNPQVVPAAPSSSSAGKLVGFQAPYRHLLGWSVLQSKKNLVYLMLVPRW